MLTGSDAVVCVVTYMTSPLEDGGAGCKDPKAVMAHSFLEGKSSTSVSKDKSGTVYKRLLCFIQNTIHTRSQI